MKDMYKLDCEWDIGQDYVIFTTREGAIKWAAEVCPTVGIMDEIDDLLDEGLVVVREVEVIEG